MSLPLPSLLSRTHARGIPRSSALLSLSGTRLAATASSRKWVARQSRDPFVAQRNEDSFRSRSAYKLQEIDQKYRIFSSGTTVVDLGAAPGGWSEYAASAMRQFRHHSSKEKSKDKASAHSSEIIAVDLLPIEPIPGVTTIKGDFLSSEVYEQLSAKLARRQTPSSARSAWASSDIEVDVVLSDMCANTSGSRDADIANSLELCTAVLIFAQRVFSKTIPKGPGRGTRKYLVMKYFTDPEFDTFRKTCERFFDRVEVFKPRSSRSESSEMYLVCRDYRDDGYAGIRFGGIRVPVTTPLEAQTAPSSIPTPAKS